MATARQLLRASGLTPDELIAAVKTTRDVEVMHHLAQRFYHFAEHFYPPQVVTAAEAFARAGYSDCFVEQAFMGRLDDVMQNCSPKRAVQVLRAATVLKVNPVESWWPVVEPLCVHHVKNIVEGIPATVDALGSLPVDTHELLDAYCFQLQCIPTPVAVFSKSLERLSRHYQRQTKLDVHKDRAYELLKDDNLHPRDRLNLVAACQRLQWSSNSSEVDVDELQWQSRLHVRTPLTATKNRIEEKLQDVKYVTFSLPDELLDLALLGESEFVRLALQAPRVAVALKKYTPYQLAQMVRAACLAGDISSAFIRDALSTLDILYPQLDLAQRIWVHEAATLCDHALQNEEVHVSERLFGDYVAVGSVGVVSSSGTKGWRPQLVEDAFCDGEVTPTRELRDRYLAKRGWNVEYR